MPKKIDEKKRGKFTGRRHTSPFLSLPHHVIDSPQFAALGGSAVKLLIDLARQFNGANNGNLDTTQLRMDWTAHDSPARPLRDISGMRPKKYPGARWNSEATLRSALNELIEGGWVVITKHGGMNMGCHLFAVTWLPVDECPGKGLELKAEKLASHAWAKKLPLRNPVLSAPESGAAKHATAPKSGAAKRLLKAA